MTVALKSLQARGVFIDNRWQAAHSGKTLPVLAPATGEIIGSIAARLQALSRTEDVSAA